MYGAPEERQEEEESGREGSGHECHSRESNDRRFGWPGTLAEFGSCLLDRLALIHDGYGELTLRAYRDESLAR